MQNFALLDQKKKKPEDELQNGKKHNFTQRKNQIKTSEGYTVDLLGRRQNGPNRLITFLPQSLLASFEIRKLTRSEEERFRSGMSGATLCALLGDLGYEGADALDPDSFEWPFQYDDARPILDWVCSSLRPSNVLSLTELSR